MQKIVLALLPLKGVCWESHFFQYIRFKEEVRFVIKSVWSPRIMNHLTWRAINTVNRVLKSGTSMLSTELRLGQMLNVVIKLIHFSVFIC